MEIKKEGLRKVLHEAWLAGYEQAIEAMRDWARTFGDEEIRTAVLMCADMIESAKPK